MPLSWKIEYTDPAVGTPVDITAKCAGFSITASMNSFAREMTIDVIDKAFYDSIGFSSVPADPPIEIFTKTADTWFSQGRFFLERPQLAAAVHSNEARGVWGRSITGKLSEPFADRVTKVWESDTTFFNIAAELCTLCGLTFDEAKSDVDNFVLFARTLESENRYPADILSELCMLAGALLSCDRQGDLFIRQVEYTPATSDASVSDMDDANFTETPVYPSFGNRVKIIPTGAAGGYQVTLFVGGPCVSARKPFKKPVYARITDADGNPVSNVVVDWTLEFEGNFSGLAKLQQASTNTDTVRFFREKKQAESFYRVKTELAAKTILGIYAYRGSSRSHNFAAAGYTLDGDTVILSESLEYCDQTLLVDYEAEGVAANYLIPNGSGTLGQTATLKASVSGQEASDEIYINNGCQCPVTLSILANPASISVGESCDILVYAEEAGGPVTDGRQVFLEQSAKIGFLKSLVLNLAAIAINNEQTEAANVIAGVTQCEISMFPSSVYGVWQAGTDASGDPIRVGGNLYASHQGKVIIITQALPAGTPLLAAYFAYGAGLTYFRGGKAGTTRITAQIEGNTEEPITAYTDVTVVDEETPLADSYTPPEWDPYDHAEPDWENYDFYDLDDFTDTAGSGNEGAIEVPCDQKCEEQYPPGSGRDQCITDCEAANDPGIKVNDGESFDETDDESGCDGKTCGEGERCCFSGSEYGCFPLAQCTGAVPYEPPEDCEAKCDDEFDRHGTTEVYDEGSMRSISEIVVQDFGYEEGSPGYYEKYDALKADALAECLADCQACEDADPLATDAPQTMSPDSEILILISGGKAPYTATLKSGAENGFSMTSAGDEIVLSQSAEGCGAAEIEITDACGTTITVGVRSTNGQWNLLGDKSCMLPGDYTYTSYFERIDGKYMSHVWTGQVYSGGGDCGECADNCSGYGLSSSPCAGCVQNFWDLVACILGGDIEKSVGDGFGYCCRQTGGGSVNCYANYDIVNFEWGCP